MRNIRNRSPFDFHVVCETLGLEPGALRIALDRLRAQNVRRAGRSDAAARTCVAPVDW
ncbi:MAG: hypothetical protein U0802_07795 [Candidatus Binatia bacterium]